MALEKPLLDSPLILFCHLSFVTALEVDKGHGITEKCILHFSIKLWVGGEAWRVVYLPGGVIIHPLPRPPEQVMILAGPAGGSRRDIRLQCPPFVASAKEAGCSDFQDHRTLPQRSLQCIGWWEQIRQPDSIAIVSLKARLTWGTFGIQNLSSYGGDQRPPRLDLAGQKCKCLTPSARSYLPQCLCIPHSVFHHLSTLLSQVSCSGVDHGFAKPRR